MFGRLKEQPPPQSMVGASTSPAAPEDAGSSGPPEGLILLLFTIVTVAASVVVLHNAAGKAETDPVQKAARGEIQGLDSLSFFRSANLKKALAKVEGGRWPLIISVRVAATRVDVSARDRDGYRKYLSINPAFKVQVTDANVGEDKTFASSAQIDTGAPERMIRAVAERTRMSPNAVDYLVTDPDNDRDSAWYMSLDQGPARVRQWVATRGGSDLRHPGELSQAQKAANAKREREFKRRQQREARHFKCLSRAFTPAQFARCDKKFPI